MIGQTKVYDLVFNAMRETGVVSLGDDMDPLVAAEALLALNAIRAEWSLNTKNYNVYTRECTVAGNTNSITLGSDGVTPTNIAVRPNTITDVITCPGDFNTSVRYPIGAPRPYDEYQKLPIVNVQAIPNVCYADNGFPIQTLYFYPGLTPGWRVRVVGMAYLSEYETIAAAYQDPPEYFRPLYLALAASLCNRWGIDPSISLLSQLKSALKHMQNHMFATRLGSVKFAGVETKGQGAFNFMAGR